MRFSRSTLALALTLCVFLLHPALAGARSIPEIVNVHADRVDRVTFIAWVLEAMDIDRSVDTCDLPFARVPRGHRGTICAAQDYGVLEALRSTRRYTLGQLATRGDALLILATLVPQAGDPASVESYRDVTTAPMQRAVGIALSQEWMKPRTSTRFGIADPLNGREALAVLSAVFSDAPTTVIRGAVQRVTDDDVLPKQSLIVSIWNLLRREYLHAEDIDDTEAAYRAVEALVESLGDPYTTFYRPEQADSFSLHLKGEIDGIGAHVESKDGAVVVIAPIAGSPAERAGIRSGDRILKADDVSLLGLSLERAISHIRGPRGTSVRLLIDRSGNTFEVTVVRQMISVPEIDVRWQGDVAIVALAQFGEATDDKFRSILSDIVARSPQGIVLDLRRNGGGLLHAAGVVMSSFLPQGTIFARVESPKEKREVRTEEVPVVPASVKLAVLVDHGSASASEIVAGAMQDHGRGIVIGSQTFGKGTVQQVLSFPDGEALKVTTDEWHTPLGRAINGIGITPDIVLTVDDTDTQLRRAVEVLLR